MTTVPFHFVDETAKGSTKGPEARKNSANEIPRGFVASFDREISFFWPAASKSGTSSGYEHQRAINPAPPSIKASCEPAQRRFRATTPSFSVLKRGMVNYGDRGCSRHPPGKVSSRQELRRRFFLLPSLPLRSPGEGSGFSSKTISSDSKHTPPCR